jgi:hypothetical protein
MTSSEGCQPSSVRLGEGFRVRLRTEFDRGGRTCPWRPGRRDHPTGERFTEHLPHERQRRREAAPWERGVAIPQPQHLGGLAVGLGEESVGLVELLADPLPDGVEARGRRLLGPVRLGSRLLPQDDVGPEGRPAGGLSLGRGVLFDLLDQGGDSCPVGLGGEVLPAGEGYEGERLGLGETVGISLLPLDLGQVLLVRGE